MKAQLPLIDRGRGQPRPRLPHPVWRSGLHVYVQAVFLRGLSRTNAAGSWCPAARGHAARNSGTAAAPVLHGAHALVSFQVRELRAVVENLRLLCPACHRWVHSRANVERELLGDRP